MIRDPSDGSVREPPKAEAGIPVSKPMTGITPAMPDTGISQPTKTDAQERLERSREWLKDYHHRKEVNNARGNDHGEELQAAGDSVEDVREAESGSSA